MTSPQGKDAPAKAGAKPSSNGDGAPGEAQQGEIQTRLDELGRKLDIIKGAEKKHQPSSSRGNALGIAMRMGSEFVVAVLIGGAMGWYLDQWLGTTPFLLFLFLMFGFAAGTRNIIRLARQMEEKDKQPAPEKDNTGKTD